MKKILLSLLFIVFATFCYSERLISPNHEKLLSLQGVKSVEPLNSDRFTEKYLVRFTQFVNGDNSKDGTFEQRLVVGIKNINGPTVLVTEGYYGDYALREDYEEELTANFNANIIFCEYRYFGESTPHPTNWDFMTVDNSLKDYHHIRQAFDSFFKGKWISTGISKGGQTTMFYRATYPNDVDISVSYVAPLNKSVEDGRHEIFLSKKVGTKAERKVIKKAQQEFMKRKNALLPLFKQYNKEKGLKYYISEEDIYDYSVLEYPFALWQWGTSTSTIPNANDGNQAWFKHLMSISDPSYFAYPNKYEPFTVQALRELGYYGYDISPIKKWASVKDTKGYLKQLMLPDSLRAIEFDATLYNRTVKYLTEEDPKHIFIYGEIDPWSASGVCTWLDCKNKKNMKVYVQPRGSHKSRIGNMPLDMKREIIDRLSLWLGE